MGRGCTEPATANHARAYENPRVERSLRRRELAVPYWATEILNR
jgi:hypothetical protein